MTKIGSVSIHRKNIQDLVIETFKVKNNLAPKTVNDLFDNKTGNHYDLRRRKDFKLPFENRVCHGNESISYLGPKI